MNLLQSISTIIFALFLLPLSGKSQLYFSSNGIEIHYNISGKGEPVVLLHGFTENIQVAWEQPIADKTDYTTLQRLTQDFQVIAIDVRGHGRSGKPIGQNYYGTATVKDVVNLLDYLGIEQAHLVGYSMGAIIASNFLAEHESRVKSITMIGAVPVGKEVYQNSPALQLVNLETTDCLYSDCGINPLIDFVLPGEQSHEMLDAISHELLSGQNRVALASCLLGFIDLLQMDIERIKNNQKPIYIIMGQYDPFHKFLLPFKELSNTTIEVIEGATHIDVMSKQEMIDSVSAFLKSGA